MPIAGALDLRVIAECAGEPVEELRALNPELRRLATPADRTFALRVPAAPQTVAECVSTLPAEKRVNFRKHVVRRGQTLAGIARANGVSARDVAEANGLAPGGRLRPGTELIIPIPAHARVATVRHERRPDVAEGRRVRYRIKPGDTLHSIAAAVRDDRARSADLEPAAQHAHRRRKRPDDLHRLGPGLVPLPFRNPRVPARV